MEIRIEITGITFTANEARNILLPALDYYTDHIVAEAAGDGLDWWGARACEIEGKLRDTFSTEDQRVKDGN